MKLAVHFAILMIIVLPLTSSVSLAASTCEELFQGPWGSNETKQVVKEIFEHGLLFGRLQTAVILMSTRHGKFGNKTNSGVLTWTSSPDQRAIKSETEKNFGVLSYLTYVYERHQKDGRSLDSLKELLSGTDVAREKESFYSRISDQDAEELGRFLVSIMDDPVKRQIFYQAWTESLPIAYRTSFFLMSSADRRFFQVMGDALFGATVPVVAAVHLNDSALGATLMSLALAIPATVVTPIVGSRLGISPTKQLMAIPAKLANFVLRKTLKDVIARRVSQRSFSVPQTSSFQELSQVEQQAGVVAMEDDLETAIKQLALAQGDLRTFEELKKECENALTGVAEVSLLYQTLILDKKKEQNLSSYRIDRRMLINGLERLLGKLQVASATVQKPQNKQQYDELSQGVSHLLSAVNAMPIEIVSQDEPNEG